MPFTLAHAAFVLPARRWWRHGFLALAVGSFGPDLPYFFPSSALAGLPSTHSWSGALTVGAGLSLLLLMAMVGLRKTLVLPLWGKHRAFVARELACYARPSWLWLLAIPAVTVGSAVHYLTDAATHRNGWFVARIPALNAELPPVFGREVAVFHTIQYTASILGLAVLAWWYGRELAAMPEPPPDAPEGTPRTLGVLWLFASAFGVLAACSAGARFASPHGRIYVALTSGISAFVPLYLLLGVLLLLAGRR